MIKKLRRIIPLAIVLSLLGFSYVHAGEDEGKLRR